MDESGRDRVTRTSSPTVTSDVEARRALAAVRQRLFGDAGAPVRVGPYEVRERLGAGGMGVVYSAYDPRLDRSIALKLVHAHERLDDRQRARLVREARALARVSHPHVIEIYDVGILDEQVYIAMELVAGLTLDRWIEAAPRELSQLLAVFDQIGRGLHAAHQAGLVHRDFKPQNVIVGDDGRARVLDFGLALTTPEHWSTVTSVPSKNPSTTDRVTEAGILMGTPGYMSPEQIRGTPVDPRTDQFAFCVALFEAIHARSPFEGATLIDRLRAIELDGVIKVRNPDVPRAVTRALRRGLSAHPDARYPSMGALLGALRGRSTRRRWALVGSGVALVGAALTAAWSSAPAPTTEQPDPCAHVESALDGVWSESHASTLRETFAAADPIHGEAIWARARASLDEGAKTWLDAARSSCRTHSSEDSAEPPPLPACLARQRDELETLVERLARADASAVRQAPKAAITLASPGGCTDLASPGLSGSPAGDTAPVHDALAEARVLDALGDLAGAARAAREALTAAQEVGAGALTAEAELVAGGIAGRRGRVAESNELLERAALSAQRLGDDFVAARAACQLAFGAAYLRSDPGEGHRWIRFAEASIDRLGGSPLLDAERLNALGAVLTAEGRYDEAIEAYRGALAEARSRLGERHPKALATALNLGTLLRIVGQLDQALELTTQSIEAAEQTLGPTHPELATLLINLGTIHVSASRPADAIAPFERAAAIYEVPGEPPPPRMAALLTNLSAAQTKLGRFEDALDSAHRARTLGEQAYGEDNPKVAKMLTQEGTALRHLGRHEAARRLLDKSLRLKRAALGPDHPDVAGSLLALVEADADAGRWAEAKTNAEAALAILDEALPPTHPRRALVQIELGHIELELGHPGRARTEAEAGLALLENERAFDVERALGRWVVARSLAQQGLDLSRARTLVQQATPVLTVHRPGLADDLKAWSTRYGEG